MREGRFNGVRFRVGASIYLVFQVLRSRQGVRRQSGRFKKTTIPHPPERNKKKTLVFGLHRRTGASDKKAVQDVGGQESDGSGEGWCGLVLRGPIEKNTRTRGVGCGLRGCSQNAAESARFGGAGGKNSGFV